MMCGRITVKKREDGYRNAGKRVRQSTLAMEDAQLERRRRRRHRRAG